MDYGPEDAAKDRAEMAAEYAHIIDDLHGQARTLAGLAAAVDRIEHRLEVLDELLPAARRAAALFDTPVTRFGAARKEAADGERLVGSGEGAGRRGRARAARRKLPDA